MDPGSRPLVLWRASTVDDLVHHDELQHAVNALGGRVASLVGPTALLATNDPFSARSLRSVDPHIDQRVAVVCGPERLLHAARRGLLATGMPSKHIHFERPWW
jgi:ferredoxin-NADP reductase